MQRLLELPIEVQLSTGAGKGPAGARAHGPTLPGLRVKTSLIAQAEAEGEFCPLVFLVCLWVVGLGFFGFYFWFCLAGFYLPLHQPES